MVCKSEVQKEEAVVTMLASYDSRGGAEPEEASALHKDCKHAGRVAVA